MDRFAVLTGRSYKLFEYDGPADAERVIVLMGSGAETARETAAFVQKAGERVGVLQVRLYRPFSAEHFLAVLPDSCRAVAVLEQTKESGAPGEPLYIDVVTTLGSGGRRRQAQDHAAGDRRALWPGIEELQPGAGQSGLRRVEEARPEERLHRRHRGRCLAHQPGDRSDVFDRARRRRARAVLWPRRRRHGRRQQEQREDHCRRSGDARAGLFCLRFAQIRRADHLAPALRKTADPLALPDRVGQFHRLPSGGLSRPDGRAAARGCGRHIPAQHAVWTRHGVGPAAALAADADPGEEASLFRNRRFQGRARHRPRWTHQHGAADLLLCDLRRAAARRGDQTHQGLDREDAMAPKAPTWCAGTSRPSTTRWRICSR